MLDLPDYPIDEYRLLVEKEACARSLARFIKGAWAVVEPGAEYFHNWHIDFIAEHLEAITRGDEVDGRLYNRLLINVPPGMMKSLLVSVFWPAWIWGPQKKPETRFLCVSHNIDLAIRDNTRMRRLITSEWYQARWGDLVQMTADQNAKGKFENTRTGFRQAAAAGAVTGNRADVVIIDDPHSVESAASEAERMTTKDWFLEALPTRLNKPKESAIVMIMQRLHEEDCSGLVLEHKGGLPGWDHIMLPMRFDPERAHATMLGYRDPRDEDGDLLFPERFPLDTVDELEATLGPYATAGQHQQSPVPRGGGLILDQWWTLWADEKYPPLDFVCAWLDTAYTEKEENDRSALIVWGVFSTNARGGWLNATDTHRPGAAPTAFVPPVYRSVGGGRQEINRVYAEGSPNVVMMYAWAGRYDFPTLCKKVIKTCRDYKVDRLLIEDKAAGFPLAQELRRSFQIEDFGVEAVKVDRRGGASADKWSRLYAVQHIFSEGLVWAPDKTWAEEVIREVSTFPKGKHDDLVDCVSGGLGWLRTRGFLKRANERLHEIDEAKRNWGRRSIQNAPPLYPV